MNKVVKLDSKLNQDVMINVIVSYILVLQFNNFLSNAGCISYGFSDSGLFGLYLKGINTHVQIIF